MVYEEDYSEYGSQCYGHIDVKYYIDKHLAEKDLKERCKDFHYNYSEDAICYKLQEISTED